MTRNGHRTIKEEKLQSNSPRREEMFFATVLFIGGVSVGVNKLSCRGNFSFNSVNLQIFYNVAINQTIIILRLYYHEQSFQYSDVEILNLMLTLKCSTITSFKNKPALKLELERASIARARVGQGLWISGLGLAILRFELVGLGQRQLRACWALAIFNNA